MTDPTGRSFLSYRRPRQSEVAMVIEAQHVRGIPTWQDIENIDEGPTERQLRDALADETTANGILWITPDVADSDFIQRIEAPALLKRATNNDGFFVVPVAAGGLDYDGAAAALKNALSLEDLRVWNVTMVSTNPITEPEAAQIADRVLHDRLAAIHRALPAEAPLSLTLSTWAPLPFQPGTALAMDWSRQFQGRSAKNPRIWDETLLPALRSTVAAIEHDCPGRRVVAGGQASLTAATALGVEFLSPRGLHVEWRQVTSGQTPQIWSLSIPAESSGFTYKIIDGDLASEELAVLVSVTDDVSNAFTASRSDLPRLRAILHVESPATLPRILSTAGQATDVARIVVEGIRQVRRERGPLTSIHLFMAAPVGLAMLIGQSLNTLGTIRTYEYAAANGKYKAEAVFQC